jgi:hypothetical protein
VKKILDYWVQLIDSLIDKVAAQRSADLINIFVPLYPVANPGTQLPAA